MAGDAELARVAAAIAAGDVAIESALDALLPEAARVLSAQHWSPLRVAIDVARWLDELGARTAVDLGSGAGKLCVAAALAGRARWLGLEHRPHLVAAADALAEALGVAARARFIVASIADGPWPEADAYFLFNPFEENLHGADDHIDERVVLGPERWDREVPIVTERLAALPPGAIVVLYNGYGGGLPDSFDRLRDDGGALVSLSLWRRSGRPARGWLSAEQIEATTTGLRDPRAPTIS